MDVSRIAEQEGAAFAEMLRNRVMDMIGRKPVHFPDIDLQVLDRPIADVMECECIGAVRALVAHGSDKARSPRPGERKNRQEIGLVKVDMEFAVERAAGGFNIGDIEKLTVTASRKACADRLAHSRAGAVTASDVARLAGFLPALRPLKAGNHPLAFVSEADQFGAALDRDADCFQSIDQQPLMLVLWEDVQKRIRREVRADALEGQARRRFALDP